MLMDYINTAMAQATYEILEDTKQFYGEIPECNGVYAQAHTLDVCRKELEEVLEGWILFRIAKQLPLPSLNGIDLRIKEVA